MQAGSIPRESTQVLQHNEDLLSDWLMHPADKLTDAKVSTLVQVLHDKGMDNETGIKYYPSDLALAAQRIYFLQPNFQEPLEQELLTRTFSSYLINDLRLTPREGGDPVEACSLDLISRSRYFQNVFCSGLKGGQGKALQAHWARSFDEAELAKDFSTVSLPCPVSRVALEILLHLKTTVSDEDLTQVILDLDFLDLKPNAIGADIRKTINDTEKRKIITQAHSLTNDNVIERFVLSMEQQFNPVYENHYAYLRECCAKHLIASISSPKDWKPLAKALPKPYLDELLRLGLERHVDLLCLKKLKDDDLFKAIESGKLSKDKTMPPERVREVCGALLVSKLPDVLLGKHKKPAEWLKRFEAVIPHIARYDLLNIKGLTQEDLQWLLPKIAPYAISLNLSGYPLEQGELIFNQSFLQLQELDLSRSPLIEYIPFNREKMPQLQRMTLHDSPNVLHFNQVPLSLTHLDVRHCSSWVDFRVLTMIKSWKRVEIEGCSDEYVKEARRYFEGDVVVLAPMAVA